MQKKILKPTEQIRQTDAVTIGAVTYLETGAGNSRQVIRELVA